jgi:hypothetical protein
MNIKMNKKKRGFLIESKNFIYVFQGKNKLIN